MRGANFLDIEYDKHRESAKIIQRKRNYGGKRTISKRDVAPL
jgi:hypothetical protein